MKKRLILVFALSVILIAGCERNKGGDQPAAGDRKAPSGQSAAGVEKPKVHTIGFSQCTFEDPWRIHMNNEMKDAVDKYPDLKLVVANGENRNAKQISDVENFIVTGVDVLVISPREAAPLTAVVERAFDRGIPVIVLDRKILGEKYSCFIGASNMDIGRAAGEYVAGRIDGKGKVSEIEGILGATATRERHVGFHEVISKYPGIEVIYDQPGDYKRSPAKQIMDNALQAMPDINVVYAHNDEMAIGAFLAAKAVGRENDIIFVGIDGQGEAVSMIRKGDLDATFVYPTGAAEAVEIARKILAGEPVQKDITLSTTRITRDEHPEYKGF